MCVRQRERERKEGRMCVNTAGSGVKRGEGEKRMKNLIQSKVKMYKVEKYYGNPNEWSNEKD